MAALAQKASICIHLCRVSKKPLKGQKILIHQYKIRKKLPGLSPSSILHHVFMLIREEENPFVAARVLGLVGLSIRVELQLIPA